jgi:hypothetical protein
MKRLTFAAQADASVAGPGSTLVASGGDGVLKSSERRRKPYAVPPQVASRPTDAGAR